jgi:hypothetical protein
LETGRNGATVAPPQNSIFLHFSQIRNPLKPLSNFNFFIKKASKHFQELNPAPNRNQNDPEMPRTNLKKA